MLTLCNEIQPEKQALFYEEVARQAKGCFEVSGLVSVLLHVGDAEQSLTYMQKLCPA